MSLWIFIIPFLTINLCLFLAQLDSLFYTGFTDGYVDPLGRIRTSFPYIDGGSSISRVARFYPNYLIFKPGMIITAVLVINYWRSNYTLFNSLNDKNNYARYFRFFGICSAIFLILHSIFLGIKFDLSMYKIFRRLIIFAFVLFELIAQGFLVANMIKVKTLIQSHINPLFLKLKILLVSTLIIVAILSIPIMSSGGNAHIKHMLEWNFVTAILLFYLLTNLLWKKDKPSVTSRG